MDLLTSSPIVVSSTETDARDQDAAAEVAGGPAEATSGEQGRRNELVAGTAAAAACCLQPPLELREPVAATWQPLSVRLQRMVHLHGCTEDSGSRALFDGLGDVYDLFRSTSSGGGGGGGGGVSRAAARGAGGGARSGGGSSAFKGICRGCNGYHFEMLRCSDLAREVQDL